MNRLFFVREVLQFKEFRVCQSKPEKKTKTNATKRPILLEQKNTTKRQL